MSHYSDGLYADLAAMSESAFPKRCPSCGEIYLSAEDFIARTQGLVRHSGLKEAEHDDGSTIVELYRNCPCGSTLLDYFGNRRDDSERGRQRREAFERLLQRLARRGIADATARQELLKLMSGGRSALIESLLKEREDG